MIGHEERGAQGALRVDGLCFSIEGCYHPANGGSQRALLALELPQAALFRRQPVPAIHSPPMTATHLGNLANVVRSHAPFPLLFGPNRRLAHEFLDKKGIVKIDLPKSVELNERNRKPSITTMGNASWLWKEGRSVAAAYTNRTYQHVHILGQILARVRLDDALESTTRIELWSRCGDGHG